MTDSKQKTNKGRESTGISRRDFIGSTLVGSGAALLSAQAPGALAAGNGSSDPFKLGRTMPMPLTGLDSSWTGYGGIGDYARANGNTHQEVNTAHTVRNNSFSDIASQAKDIGEHYDLVCVGSGFAGCSAAYRYLQNKPDAKVLICDNHDMFGGEARHNEFEVDGFKLWGPQGSTGAVYPFSRAKEVGMYSDLWDELGLPKEFTWQEPKNTQLKIPYDGYNPMHLNWESTDLGWFKEGHPIAVNPWKNRFAEFPIDDKTRNDLIWMEVYRQPPMRDDWEQWLDSMTYKDFMQKEMGINNPFVFNYLNPFGAAMGCGLGGDVVSAYQALNFMQPGVSEYLRHLGMGDLSNDVWLASWPGGNTGTLRHIVQRLIPGLFGEVNGLLDVLHNPIDRSLIDKSGSSCRIRLNSLVVDIHHQGKPENADKVNVTYTHNGELYRVTADHVVVAGQQHINKRIVSDLPKAHRDAMDTFVHAPMLIINVAVRNWRFLDKLGVASVRWFDDDLGWFTTLRRQMLLDGREPMPLDPDKPTVLTMYNSFCMPGLPAAQQAVAARMKLFGMSYGDIERQVREQFTKMFAAGGFDADRDIAAITTNRQGHAYVVTEPGFFFGRNGQPAPREVIRQPHGRIAFAHAELQGMQMWEGAVQEAERAVEQILAT